MFEDIKKILSEYITLEIENITEDARLVEDLGLNSYEFMSLIGRVEEEFDIELDEREVVKIKTVGEVLEYIKVQQG